VAVATLGFVGVASAGGEGHGHGHHGGYGHGHHGHYREHCYGLLGGVVCVVDRLL
jgi:hypothetical protein